MTEAVFRRRKCVGCGAERPKSEMLRVTRGPDGVISVDSTGRAPGRGTYVCPSMECVRAAMKKKSLQRALKHPVEREVYAMLELLCADGKDDDGGRD